MDEENKQNLFCSVKEAAFQLNVSGSTVRSLAHSGKLPFHKTKKGIFVSRRMVAELAQKNSRQAFVEFEFQKVRLEMPEEFTTRKSLWWLMARKISEQVKRRPA